MPEAAPASVSGTVASAMSTSGTTSSPNPIPASSIGSARLQKVRSSPTSWMMRATHQTPTAWSSAPARQTVLPTLSPSGTEMPVPTKAPMLKGSSISPAWKALKPRPAWT